MEGGVGTRGREKEKGWKDRLGQGTKAKRTIKGQCRTD